MKQKKFLGKLISVKFTDRKTPLSGLIIDYNDQWTLMKSNPVDYMIDGYIIFKHKNVEGFCRDEDEKFKEKILRLKGIEIEKKDLFPITDLSTILTGLTKKYSIFRLDKKSEKVCYVGRFKSLDNKQLIIKTLDTKGKWDGQKIFKPDDIRIIEFNTDYLNSLKLLLKD